MRNTILAFSILCALSSCESTPEKILISEGYIPTVPPTTLRGPGSIVSKDGKPMKSKAVALSSICSARSINFAEQPDTSPTEIFKSNGDNNFTFQSSGLKKLGLELSPTYVDSVTLSFSNVEVQEYSLEQLNAIAESLGPRCRNAVRTKHKNAYIVASAIKADLDYTVTFKAGVKASAKNVIFQELSSEFGLNINRERGRTGRGLYYGVKLEALP